MSTIYGYTGKVLASDLMGDALRHWEPDREAIFSTKDIFLGALELYKTPECLISPQPFKYKDYFVVADCRIDNREDLAIDLNINDISKHSDIEFVARAFEKYGEKAPLKLYGDFAFVIWNSKTNEIFAARDHFGVRTLYYSLVDNELVFASEIKGILAFPNFQKKFNQAYIVSEFSALLIPEDSTMYENIFLLPAGHYFTFKSGKVERKKYYQLGDLNTKVPDSVEEQEAEFNRLVVQSVRTRLRTYRQLGAEVSGGLDSTGIAATAMEILGKNYPFYSFCYAKPENSTQAQKDDTHIVRELCAKYGIEEYFTPINEKDLPIDELIGVSLKVYDDYESNGVPMFTASFLKYAQEKEIGVMLSGWAGDQIVTNTCGGFPEPLAYEKRYLDLWKDLTRRHSVLKSIPRFIAYALKCWNRKGFYNKNLRKQRELLENQALKKSLIDKYDLSNLPGLRYYLKSCTDIRTYQLLNFTHMGIQSRTFNHVLMGKHFKVDYRFPMIDVRLVDYIHHLPFSTLAPKGKTRYLYKKYVFNLVPRELLVVHKSKVPTTPFAYEYLIENLPRVKSIFFDIKNHSEFTNYLDDSKLQELANSNDEDMRKEYLKMYFFAKKMEKN